MNEDEIEALVEEFWLRREVDPQLSSVAFANDHPSCREPLLAALAASLDVDAALPRAEDTPLPRAIGPYRVRRELGRGGMGIVWEVERDGRRLALKVLSNPALCSVRAQARFRREIEVLGKLHHPGIIAIEDTGLHDGQPYFVMERLSDRSLQDVDTPLATERTVALGHAIADAVAAAHAQGIWHRDLKPGNVLLRDDGTPVVVDFGLAADADEPTLTGSADVLGTPRYMAPEQAAGRPTDARTDVYAIGAILWQLLTGEPPHAQSGSGELLAAARRGSRLRAPSNQPRPLLRILRTALARRPQWRYPHAGALADDLARFQRGEPIAAHPPGPLRRGVDHLVQSPRTVLGVVALGVLALLAQRVWLAEPGDAELGRRYLQAGRAADAAAAYRRAIDAAPESADLHQGLASALEKLGDFAGSLTAVERALALAPDDRPGWRNQRGVLLDRLGEHGRAQEVFRQLVDEHPDDADYRFNLGYSLDADLQVRAASEVYAEVLRRHPDHHVARVTLAWLHATAKGAFADLRDPGRAEALALEALRGDRGRTEGVLLTIQAIARTTGRTDRILPLLEEIAADTTNDAIRGRLQAIARSLR